MFVAFADLKIKLYLIYTAIISKNSVCRSIDVSIMFKFVKLKPSGNYVNDGDGENLFGELKRHKKRRSINTYRKMSNNN